MSRNVALVDIRSVDENKTDKTEEIMSYLLSTTFHDKLPFNVAVYMFQMLLLFALQVYVARRNAGLLELLVALQHRGPHARGCFVPMKIVCLYLTSISAQLTANWTRLAGETQTQRSKTASKTQCAHVSYVAIQQGYTYNTKSHEQHKPKT